MRVEHWEKFLRTHRGTVAAAFMLYRQNRDAPEAECMIETRNLLIAFANVTAELRGDER